MSSITRSVDQAFPEPNIPELASPFWPPLVEKLKGMLAEQGPMETAKIFIFALKKFGWPGYFSRHVLAAAEYCGVEEFAGVWRLAIPQAKKQRERPKVDEKLNELFTGSERSAAKTLGISRSALRNRRKRGFMGYIRPLKCSRCGETGHNRRRCTK